MSRPAEEEPGAGIASFMTRLMTLDPGNEFALSRRSTSDGVVIETDVPFDAVVGTLAILCRVACLHHPPHQSDCERPQVSWTSVSDTGCS